MCYSKSRMRICAGFYLKNIYHVVKVIQITQCEGFVSGSITISILEFTTQDVCEHAPFWSILSALIAPNKKQIRYRRATAIQPSQLPYGWPHNPGPRPSEPHLVWNFPGQLGSTVIYDALVQHSCFSLITIYRSMSLQNTN